MKANSKLGLPRRLHTHLMSVLKRLFGLRVNKIYVGADRPEMLDKRELGLPSGYSSQLCIKEHLLPFVGDAYGLSEEFLDASFAKGDDCAGAFRNGELVAYIFAARQRVPVTEQLDATIPEGFRTMFKGWTHPDHRRKNLCNNLSLILHNACWDKDFSERAVWYIETTNYSSRLHGYLNPKMWSLGMGYFGWFTFFGREIPFNSRWAKRIGFMVIRKSDSGLRLYAD